MDKVIPIPTSESGSSPPPYTPPGSIDPGWRYGHLTNKSDTNSVTCRLCSKLIKGGINRLKQHLAHIRGNVAPCKQVDEETKKAIKDYMEGLSKKKEVKAKELKEFREEVDIGGGGTNTGVGGTSTEIESDSVTKRPRVEVSDARQKGKMRQKCIKETFVKDQRDRVCGYLAKWVFKAGLSFNSLMMNEFVAFCEAVGQYGPGFVPPSYHELSQTLLKKEVQNTKERLQTHIEECKRTGCSIMTDAWTDRKDSCIIEVGVDVVVQVVTDNASANLAAGRIMKAKYPHIFWTSRAAHCIDLMLEEIDKEPRVKSTVEKARIVTTFIYSHMKTLSMMRHFTEKGEIVRPGATRFATMFLSLESLYSKREKLRMMFTSEEWMNSKWYHMRKGLSATSIVMNMSFWNQVTLAIKIFTPLVRLLRIVDGEQRPSMGFVYAGLEDAKKEIMELVKDLESAYAPFIAPIIAKSKGRLDGPLHCAAYYLNPYFFFRDRALIESNRELKSKLLECIEIFYPDLDIQDIITRKELIAYMTADGLFGKPLAVKQRSINNDDYNPANWWDVHGLDTPHLQLMACKILNLTTSSSGCERNWSSFEGIHTKKRNRLEVQKLNDLVYVQFTAKLMDRKKERAQNGKDPLSSKDRVHVYKWIAENDAEEEVEVFSSSGLTRRGEPSTSTPSQLLDIDENMHGFDESDDIPDDETDDDVSNASIEWDSD